VGVPLCPQVPYSSRCPAIGASLRSLSDAVPPAATDTCWQGYVLTERPPCLLVFSCRDVECAGTVEHMFDQADVPERVFVGVCEQNHELPGSEEDCTTGMG
jgi:Glycosyltransferase (GlcNAc)